MIFYWFRPYIGGSNAISGSFTGLGHKLGKREGHRLSLIGWCCKHIWLMGGIYPNLYDKQRHNGDYLHDNSIGTFNKTVILGLVAWCKNFVDVKVIAKLCHKSRYKVCSSMTQKSMRSTMSKDNFIQKHLGDDNSFGWRQGCSFDIPRKVVAHNKNVSISKTRNWKKAHTVSGNNFPWSRDGDSQKRLFGKLNISFVLGTRNLGFDPAL